jgi:flagellar motor switch protein FliN/FliY
MLGVSPLNPEATTWHPTPLEAFLADRFLNHLCGWLLEQCINPDAVDSLEPDAEQAVVVWGLQALNGKPIPSSAPLAWLALQCPLPMLPSQQAGTGHYSQWLTSQAFAGSTQVTLVAGKTSLPLQQLKGIVPDALIVLEESHACQLALVHPATGQWLGFDIPPAYQGWLDVFPISAEELEQALASSPPSSSPLTRPTEAHAMSSHPYQASGQDPAQLWDHLLIDVHAQFEPTRLPLQHLKQMSEGLVVDVGSLLDNKVSLVANGKALAQGQLVVVGDRLGVLVTSMLGTRDTTAQGAAVASLQTLVPLAQAAGGAASPQTMATTAKPQHPVKGVEDALVLKAESLGLNVAEMVAMAQQQGLAPAEAIAQAVALHDDDDPDSEVARANAMMAEVDEVLNSPE